ncbi:MAG TPA: ABC transporter permease/substrate-binding protein [Polyangiaceae bacterium]
MSDLLRGLQPLLSSHLALVLIALAIASVIALPLAIVASSRPRLAFAVVTGAGVIQTVPGLALLALMVPVLAKTGVLSPFGFAPAVIALTLYAMLPILRNAVTGIRGVDPAAVEAARGMGMSPWQIMRLVELPLAAPVIAAGVRMATVWTVGAATLATPVGQPSLGNYIFAGLQTRNFTMLLVGVAASAALALALDGILALAERSLRARRRRFPFAAAASFVALAALVFFAPRFDRRATTAHATQATAVRAVTHVRLGGKPFTEQYVLVELMRARLESAGIGVDVAEGLGSTMAFDALVRGDIDAYVDYSGTLWTNEMKRAGVPPRWQIEAEVSGWLAHEHGIRSLGRLGFENEYVLAMRRDVATRLGLRTLADLARAAPKLSIGADYEFFSRAEWDAVRRAYGLDFAKTANFDPALLYDAVQRGDVDVITAFSSDGRIAADDLVVLDDPAGALPAYDAMILVGARAAGDRHVACALVPLQVPVERMRVANAMVDRDKKTPAEAAAWLLSTMGTLPDCSKL